MGALLLSFVALKFSLIMDLLLMAHSLLRATEKEQMLKIFLA